MERKQHRDAGQQKGSLAISFALVLPMLLFVVFASIDVAHMVLVKRDLQKVADMASIAAAEGLGSGAQQIALDNAEQNGFQPAAEQLTATEGYWDPRTLPGPEHFSSHPPPDNQFNAVKVVVSRQVPYFVFLPPVTLKATAISYAPNAAGIGIASTLLKLDTQQSHLLNAVLGGLLGTHLNLSLAGYQGLANANISLGALAEQLHVGTVNSLLSAKLSLHDLYQGTLNVLGNSTAGGLLHGSAAYGSLASLAYAVPDTPVNIQLGKIIKLGLTNAQAAADAQVNLLGLITASAMLANGKHFVDIPNLNIGNLVSLKLSIISPPQLAYGLPGKNASGHYRTVAKTAQVALDLNILDNLVSVMLQASPAEARLENVMCALPPQNPQVEVSAGTALLSGQVNIMSSSNPPFTAVPPQNYQTVSFSGYPLKTKAINSSSNGAQPVTLTVKLFHIIHLKLGDIISSIIILLQPVLRALGISLGTAKVMYTAVGCGSAYLVY